MSGQRRIEEQTGTNVATDNFQATAVTNGNTASASRKSAAAMTIIFPSESSKRRS